MLPVLCPDQDRANYYPGALLAWSVATPKPSQLPNSQLETYIDLVAVNHPPSPSLYFPRDPFQCKRGSQAAEHRSHRQCLSTRLPGSLCSSSSSQPQRKPAVPAWQATAAGRLLSPHRVWSEPTNVEPLISNYTSFWQTAQHQQARAPKAQNKAARRRGVRSWFRASSHRCKFSQVVQCAYRRVGKTHTHTAPRCWARIRSFPLPSVLTPDP